MITAQILTIVSIGFAWVFWITFVVNLAGIALFQIFWCVRTRSGPLYGHAIIAGLISMANLVLGSYMLVAWREKRWCNPWGFYVSDDRYRDDDQYTWPNQDDCYEETWFAIALVCALLWAAAMMCMIWFVKSGRHAKWEEKHTTPPPTEVDITMIPPSNEETGEETAIDDDLVSETEKEEGQSRCACL